MASSGGSGGPGPKILLAKPAAVRAEGSGSGPAGIKLMRDRDDDGSGRRIPPGSLNLLSDTWDLTPDRYLPVSTSLTKHQDFRVFLLRAFSFIFAPLFFLKPFHVCGSKHSSTARIANFIKFRVLIW